MNLFYILIVCAAVIQAQSTGGDTEILNQKEKRQQARRERIQAKKALRKQQRQNSIKKKRAERKAAKEKKLKDKIAGSGGQTTVIAPTTTSFGQNFVDGENFEWGFDIDDVETTMATTTVFVEPFTTVKSASSSVVTTPTTAPTTTPTSSTTARTSTTTSLATSSTTTSTSTSTTTSTTITTTTTVPATELETSTAATQSSTVGMELELENTTATNPENILPDDFSNFLNDLSGLITPKSKFYES